MEPVPETAAAFEQLGRADGDFAEQARDTARRVRDVVPECVGLSIELADPGLTFTLVAPDSAVAGIDALEYLSRQEPAGSREQRLDVVRTTGLLRAEPWLLVAAGEVAGGIESTLSLPLRVDDTVVGRLTLYACSARAFEGRRRQLAELVGADAAEAVADADLAFATRLQAAAAPVRLEEEDLVDCAVAVLAAHAGLDHDAARARLRATATMTAVPVPMLARLVIDSPRRAAQDPRGP